jgi:hypothetical protein
MWFAAVLHCPAAQASAIISSSAGQTIVVFSGSLEKA